MRLLLAVLLLLFCSVPLSAGDSLLIDNFDNGIAGGWSETIFSGHTLYRAVPDDSGQVLMADSEASASGLVYDLDLEPKDYPVVSWRWKIEKPVPGGNVYDRERDDYAARIYVVFPHWYFPKTRSVNYIWSNTLPEGEAVPSQYTENSMMIAVTSGDEQAGEWVDVKRNVYEDYRQLFGEEPPRIGAIAIMTDTDNTGETVRAWYDDIRFERATVSR